MEPKMRLTVHFRAGVDDNDKVIVREVSGMYDWLGAMARLHFAQALPDFVDFSLGAP